MAIIQRVESGLIFEDNMETVDSRWEISPSDSFTHRKEERTLNLTHNDRGYTTALFDIPQDEDHLLFEVHANYYPQEVGDEGGLVVWKSAMEKLEFFESVDSSEEGDYSYWRVIKRNNLWAFYAYKNGSWELFDSSVCINPVFMGVGLSGIGRTGYRNLGIRKALLCRGKHITVGNVNTGYIIQLLDDLDVVIEEQIVPTGHSGSTVELPWIPFTGKVKVIDVHGGNAVVAESEVLEIYGGDVFMIGTDLTVFWKGNALDENNPTNIGAMKYGVIEEKMTLANTTSGNVAEDIAIKVAVYRDSFGWEWASVSNDLNGKPVGFTDSIEMGTLQAGETRDFWVRVDKGVEFSTKPIYFMLDITNK